MIELAQIQKFIESKPFRAFALETSDGNYVTVQSPEHIKLPPKGFDLVLVFGTDGLVHYVQKDSILNAAVYGPEPFRSQE